MAIIAIFCDGTWNSFDNPDQTHVARFSQACAETVDQMPMYFQGVGTGEGMISDMGRWLSKVGGGVFGWGLTRNLKAAYHEVCKCYEPGDKIMVFGFSRGAYTARSLVGMIRKCGILSDPTAQNLRRAVRLYRRRGSENTPDKPHIWAERRALSPQFATSPKDVIRRADGSALVRVSYVGVWDTVGALGVPRSVLGPIASLWNRRYSFHDTSLSGLVEQARHAVALDERRVLFEPCLWDNLETSQAGPGLNFGDQSETRRYQQKWFVGNHGIVGGSVAPMGLAMASLVWIWQGAEDAGLRLKPDTRLFETSVDMATDAPELYRVTWLFKLARWLVRWRKGPTRSQDLHDTARLRATVLPSYRPRSLYRILPGLF